MANSSFPVLKDVVGWDKQRRFELLFRPRVASPLLEDWWLRIRKGYFQHPDLCLKRVTSACEIPVAIYTTTPEVWQTIQHFGIPRGDAPFLHLSHTIPRREPIVGKKPHVPSKPSRPASLTTCKRRPLPDIWREKVDKVIIYIDTAKVLASDIPLYTSTRNTVATPGNTYGVLPLHCFERVDIANIRMERDNLEVENWEDDVGQRQEDAHSERDDPPRWREWRGPAPSSPADDGLSASPNTQGGEG
ncbi:hypothetical protein NMY22_g9917 [Coprinellus aureogranulatus]|nr:hypothetical protein NMY22_g9917 [Coprinellus aureogranulatus]